MSCNKTQYSDKKGAKTVLNQMRNDPKIARKLPYRPNRVYYCAECGAWHITSVRKHYPLL